MENETRLSVSVASPSKCSSLIQDGLFEGLFRDFSAAKGVTKDWMHFSRSAPFLSFPDVDAHKMEITRGPKVELGMYVTKLLLLQAFKYMSPVVKAQIQKATEEVLLAHISSNSSNNAVTVEEASSSSSTEVSMPSVETLNRFNGSLADYLAMVKHQEEMKNMAKLLEVEIELKKTYYATITKRADADSDVLLSRNKDIQQKEFTQRERLANEAAEYAVSLGKVEYDIKMFAHTEAIKESERVAERAEMDMQVRRDNFAMHEEALESKRKKMESTAAAVATKKKTTEKTKPIETIKPNSNWMYQMIQGKIEEEQKHTEEEAKKTKKRPAAAITQDRPSKLFCEAM